VNRIATIVLVIFTALACMVLVYSQRMGWLQTAAAAKLIASIGYLATAISAGCLRQRVGQIVFAGLALSFFGDMFLIGQSQRNFLLGLTSFLLAHIAYITAFVTAGLNRKWALRAAMPVIAIAVLILAWISPNVAPYLATPVYIYTAVISLMVIAAFGARGAGASKLIVAGALMFFVSDLSVAAQRILQSDFPTIIWGLPLYYAGQLCFALGAAQWSTRAGADND
jgi:uncharacterized membrane protein YhhN